MELSDILLGMCEAERRLIMNRNNPGYKETAVHLYYERIDTLRLYGSIGFANAKLAWIQAYERVFK